MNVKTYYDENGRSFEDIIKEFLVLYYNQETLDFIEKYA